MAAQPAQQPLHNSTADSFEGEKPFAQGRKMENCKVQAEL